MGELSGESRAALEAFYHRAVRDQKDLERQVVESKQELRESVKTLRQLEKLYPWLVDEHL
jgi:hypothetical protein